jgi:hypothetical protein
MTKYFRMIASVMVIAAVLVPVYSAGKKPLHWEVTFEAPPNDTVPYISANPLRSAGRTFVPSATISISVSTEPCYWDTTKLNSHFWFRIENPSLTASNPNGDTLYLQNIQWDPTQTNPTAAALFPSPFPCLYPNKENGFPRCMIDFLNLGQHPFNYKDTKQSNAIARYDRLGFEVIFYEYDMNTSGPSSVPMAMDTWLAIYAQDGCPVPNYGGVGGARISPYSPTPNEFASLHHNPDGSWTIESYNNPLEFIEWGQALQPNPKNGRIICSTYTGPVTDGVKSIIRTLPVSYKVTFSQKP